ncbi:DUF433 domain-containing protein [Nocardia takedensis]
MSFPADITSALSGVTPSQLKNWRRGESPLLVPEYGVRPTLYSFRDVVALRTMAKLRGEVSLQKVRKAFRALRDMDLTDHPSRYKLVTDQDSIFLVEDDGATDLVRHPGQQILVDLDDVLAPFVNMRKEQVVDFRRPRPHLQVREGRVGGWPTIADTRIPFDTIARLVDGGDIDPSEVKRFYPGVTAAAVADAVSFQKQIERIGGRTA